MSVEERLRVARSAMDAAAREQDEQRGLRDRHVAEAREEAKAGMQREMGAAQKYAEHMEELTKRQKSAGGWATEKTLTDSSNRSVMAFGVEDEEEAPAPAYPTSVSSPVPRPEPTPPPAAPPAAEPRRGRHARQVDDEDDFSSTSWLV